MVELDRNDEANRIFRARLAVWMEYLGLTNASLAKAIGVDSSLISRWRTGKRSIAGNPEYAVLIARYLVPRIASRADRDWLKRQLAEQAEELTILQKAATYFAKRLKCELCLY